MDVCSKARATIRSLGLSCFKLWWVSKAGRTILSESVDGLAVRYVVWRGVEYTIVKKEPN
jgi:hypothetical protein